MKTESKEIKFTEFTEVDWYGFAGADDSKFTPRIACFENKIIIIDSNCIEITFEDVSSYYCSHTENELTYHLEDFAKVSAVQTVEVLISFLGFKKI